MPRFVSRELRLEGVDFSVRAQIDRAVVEQHPIATLIGARHGDEDDQLGSSWDLAPGWHERRVEHEVSRKVDGVDGDVGRAWSVV